MPLETIKSYQETPKNNDKDNKREDIDKQHINPQLFAKKLILFDYLKWTLKIPSEDFETIKENLNNIQTTNEKEKQLKNTLMQIIELLTCDRSLEPNYYFKKIKYILESTSLTDKDKKIFVKWLKENFIWFLVEKVEKNSETWYNPEAFKEEGLPLPNSEEYYMSAPWKSEDLIELLKKEFPQYNWQNYLIVAELERE